MYWHYVFIHSLLQFSKYLRANHVMGFPGGSVVKNPPAMQKMQARFLGQEDPLEKEMATHSSLLAWEIPMDRGACWATVHGSQKNQI